MKVLLIKLTSMGDLTHALPAITDAASIYPDIEFHWVVDEAFAEIPSWHPNVSRVIKSAHRRWKKNKKATWMEGEFKTFYQQLNAEQYDFQFDAQNNLKSATISLLRRGQVEGCDKSTSREYPAHWVYSKKHHIENQQHAIARQRQLFASVLGYEVPCTDPDYGIDTDRLELPAESKVGFSLPEKFLVFVHNASWQTKLYPEEHWQQLIALATKEKYSVLLPCGNDAEYQRAQRLADSSKLAFALPKMRLSETAAIMARAKGAICCDTGLAHIAGMLSLPSVALYGPTDHQLIGSFGHNQIHQVATQFQCAPCYKKYCDYNGKKSTTAACLAAFSAEQLWQKLKQQLIIAEK